jgi:formylmethanofuran dehydrogenase subunit E
MNPAIKTFEEAAAFHGHFCPGLAIGYRASVIALGELFSDRSMDEELICIAENDACSIDAVQVVTGCTIGKGNLLLRDYGKQVYTFILRDESDAVRISLRPDASMDTISSDSMKIRSRVFTGTATPKERAQFEKERDQLIDMYLEAPADMIFSKNHVSADIPEKARIFKSVICDSCGEMVTESRARLHGGKVVCIPCHDEYLGIFR